MQEYGSFVCYFKQCIYSSERFLSAPPQFIRWFREDILLADSQQPELQLPPRVTLYSNGSIQVKNVITDDTGEYICEIMTSDGLATQGHAIEVQRK